MADADELTSLDETNHSHGSISHPLSPASKAEGELALLRQQLIKEQAERQRLEHHLNGLQRKYRKKQRLWLSPSTQHKPVQSNYLRYACDFG